MDHGKTVALKLILNILMNFHYALIIFFTLNFFSCTSSEPGNEISSSFYETRWILRSLDGNKVYTPESLEEAFIKFSKDKQNANGFGGCNSIGMTYSRQNRSLKISNITATEKYCDFIKDQEKKFLDALSKTDSYKISGNRLSLYGEGKLLAVFENTGVK
ncbi:MAG: META domain-containing protein [Ignavibacteria bacterium]|nr:META domain-containing protein [Ignavibacteria bacterium]